ncbi:MAG TPA: lipase maturation factor family protein [Candidatus Acidoferrales bacterium]|nr:lipase maturation factor family protein [Candidatus Acidoferrales bacterium]
MLEKLLRGVAWLFGPGPEARPGRLWPRWLFLRALAAIYFSAFFSLLFQVQGLIGPRGILSAGEYLHLVGRQLGAPGYWYAPTLLWWSSSSTMLNVLCWAGLAASLLAFFNVWPRVSLAACWVIFLSFITALQDFAAYQSDGMLLEAGFLALFFAPPGIRPGLGASRPPSRAATFLLLWEWFRIYFESGLGKIASGDPTWRNLTAMDEYYQNGPLPTWLGWYAQQLPQRFHAATAGLTLVVELFLVLLVFLPRRFRLVLFFIVTPFEIGIIATANYCFLNYLVLWLGVLLLDDEFLARVWPYARERRSAEMAHLGAARSTAGAAPRGIPIWRRLSSLALPAGCLSWVFYGTVVWLVPPLSAVLHMPVVRLPLAPVRLIEPFSIANRYGLFAWMTWKRYEIEFQGSDDGQNWIPYPYRFKPQDLERAPLLYAPYHPRFEWNLWFAMLGSLNEAPWVTGVEVRLLEASPPVLALFAGNPFADHPPKFVRAVIYQYWFTDLETHGRTGQWWRREYQGRFGPTLTRGLDGRITLVEVPDPPPLRPDIR